MGYLKARWLFIGGVLTRLPKKNREGATPRERNIGYPGDSPLRIISLEKSGIISERKWHLPKRLNVKANLTGGNQMKEILNRSGRKFKKIPNKYRNQDLSLDNRSREGARRESIWEGLEEIPPGLVEFNTEAIYAQGYKGEILPGRCLSEVSIACLLRQSQWSFCKGAF